MIPPRAGEITLSQSNLRSLSASCPHTCAAMSVYCRRIAHWKYWRLCKPERRTKWPSSNAPVLRKRANKSSLITVRLLPRVDRFSRGRIRHRDHLDLNISALGQSRDLHRRTRGRVGFEIGAVEFVDGLEIGQIGQENRRFDDVFESQSFRS